MLELMQHEFVQNAFLAGTIGAIVTAVMGYFVVMRAQALRESPGIYWVRGARPGGCAWRQFAC